jgi:hypothetical protein
MSEPSDPLGEIWDVAEFCALEAFLLRSFLEYLQTWPSDPQKKIQRLQNWKQEIGLQLGNPKASDTIRVQFQKVRDAPPESRIEVLQQVLDSVHGAYFGKMS